MINTLIEHQRLSITFAETLQRLSEDDWRRKIAPNKWSIAEIMGHFRFWDAFLLTKRLPFFFTTQQFEPSPNVDLINEQSAAYARVTEKDKVLAEFIIHRQQIVEIDRFFPSSQLCHACGHRDGKKPLAIRVWTCSACGTTLDRDINASKNILIEGLRLLKQQP